MTAEKKMLDDLKSAHLILKLFGSKLSGTCKKPMENGVLLC